MKPYYDEDGITIYHGDCREFGGLRANCLIADPPYGQTSLEWDVWVKGWPSLATYWTVPAASMWCFGSLRMFTDNWKEFSKYWRLAQDVVWEKHNGSNFHADRFRRVHEQVAHLYMKDIPWADVYNEVPTTPDATKRTVRRKERPPHTGDIAGSTYTSNDGGPRLQRSVIKVRSEHGRAQHPTQKPLGIIMPLVEASCPPGGVVLDPFMGGGSTLLAAKQLGRRAVGIEIEEKYCEIAVQRLAQGVLSFD